MAESINISEEKPEGSVKNENNSDGEPVKDNEEESPVKKENQKKGNSKWSKKDSIKKTFKPGKFKKFKTGDGKAHQKKKPNSKK